MHFRRTVAVSLLALAAVTVVACTSILGDFSSGPPSTDGGSDAPLDVLADAADGAPDVHSTGDAGVVLAPAPFDFGPSDINKPGSKQGFSVTNDRTVATPALITGISGPDANQFAVIADTCKGLALPPGASCSVTIQFNPTSYGTKTASLEIDAPQPIIAAITGEGRDQVTLTATKTGSGTGTVTDKAGTLDCGGTCTEQVTRTANTPTVSLTATPDPNSKFNGWSGGGCTGTGLCQVAMAAAETVTADFEPGPVELTLNVNFYGPATATITSTPAGISTAVAGVAKATFTSGTTVTLSLTNASSPLYNWTGACAGVGPSCTFVISNAATQNVTVSDYNYVFVTSTTTAANFGGQSAADTICKTRAQAASLPGTYQAWVSTAATSAKTRLAATGANGWIRPDGLPFTSNLSDLTTLNRVYYPANLTELGAFSGSDVWTGTNPDGSTVGAPASPETCTDWTSTANYGAAGNAATGPGLWTVVEGYGCTNTNALYCFGTSLNRAVTITPTAGRHGFLSKGSFNTSSGLTGANTLCRGEAASAGLANAATFLALLPTPTVSASSLFDLTKPTWVRPDGLPLAATATDFMNGGLVSPPAVHADGTYALDSQVITGADRPTDPGTSATTCTNWSVASGPDAPWYGFSSYMSLETFAFSYGTPTCGTAAGPIYCLEP